MAPKSIVVSVRVPDTLIAQIVVLYESQGMAIHSKSALLADILKVVGETLPPLDEHTASGILTRVFETKPAVDLLPVSSITTVVEAALAQHTPKEEPSNDVS